MKTLLGQHSCRTLRLESSVQLLYLGHTEPAVVYKTEKISDLLSFERNVFTFSTDPSKDRDSVTQQ